MTDPRSRLQIVEEFVEPPAPPNQAALASATAMLTLALKALSQRALIALASLFTLATVASAFYLWVIIVPNPSGAQLTGLGMYALFILAVNIIVRKL